MLRAATFFVKYSVCIRWCVLKARYYCCMGSNWRAGCPVEVSTLIHGLFGRLHRCHSCLHCCLLWHSLGPKPSKCHGHCLPASGAGRCLMRVQFWQAFISYQYQFMRSTYFICSWWYIGIYWVEVEPEVSCFLSIDPIGTLRKTNPLL